MKASLLIIVFFMSAQCVFCQVQEFYVRANATDAAYPAQDSHYIARNISEHNGKLLLYIGGTFSTPKNYEYISHFAATLGFDVINIAYLNSVLTTLLAGSSDSLAFDKFRQEICFGTQVSPAVNVDSLNSIYTRAVKLLQYLSQMSSHNWGQYLSQGDSLAWEKIVVGGHSQGSGHACYLGKFFPVERVVMLAGPNDYSAYFNNAAPWLRQPGQTPVEKHYAFLHLRDEIVPFNRQHANLEGLGMLRHDDTTLVENPATPFSQSRCLYTNLAPAVSGQFHNSTAIYSSTPLDSAGNPVFNAVWQYLLEGQTVSHTSGAPAPPEQKLSVFPNPFSDALTFTHATPGMPVVVLNMLGKIVLEEIPHNGTTLIETSALPPGLYLLVHHGKIARLVKM